MKTVAIIGVGLIGGSLGQALQRSKKYRVIGLGRKPRSLALARRLGAADQVSTDWREVRQADIVVLCTPVDRIVPTFKKILPSLRPGTVVTDAGSVKGAILKAVTRMNLPRSISFVGSHPLAGSHKTGVAFARPDLFKGSTCVVIPLGKASAQSIEDLWRTARGKILRLTVDQHDRAVAVISHLPHAIAHALVHLVAGHKNRKTMLPLLAGSFRDVTRVASSDAEQWAQILRANAAQLIPALRGFRRELTRLEKNLSRRSLRAHLRRSERFRRPLFHGI